MKIDMVSVHCILCKLMNFSSTLADSDGSLRCLMVSAAETIRKYWVRDLVIVLCSWAKHFTLQGTGEF